MLAVKVAVIESERGWGQKIDDYMVCLSIEDANKFKQEFNSENTESAVPVAIDITDSQMKKLKNTKTQRMWLANLRKY
jgi:hypothetical protein